MKGLSKITYILFIIRALEENPPSLLLRFVLLYPFPTTWATNERYSTGTKREPGWWADDDRSP
jgi:hypothetical protein